MRKELSPREIRDLAFALHDSVDWSAHPCQRGNGKCCESSVPVTDFDTAIITDALKKGRIQPETIVQTVQRTATNLYRCGFLDDRNECVIYPYRPAICAASGTAGEPSVYYPEVNQLITHYLRTKEDLGVPVAMTVSSMCSNCHNQLAWENAFFSIPMMIAFQKVVMHYRTSPTIPINQFIWKCLKPKTK